MYVRSLAIFIELMQLMTKVQTKAQKPCSCSPQHALCTKVLLQMVVFPPKRGRLYLGHEMASSIQLGGLQHCSVVPTPATTAVDTPEPANIAECNSCKRVHLHRQRCKASFFTKSCQNLKAAE